MTVRIPSYSIMAVCLGKLRVTTVMSVLSGLFSFSG